MGLPARMSAAINEYWHGANMSFALCSLLTQGLIDAFTLVGTEEEKNISTQVQFWSLDRHYEFNRTSVWNRSSYNKN